MFNINFMNTNMCYCPCCGNFGWVNINSSCEYCDTTVIFSGIENEDCDNTYTDVQKAEIRRKIIKEKVFKSPQFDLNKWNYRARESENYHEIFSSIQEFDSPPPVHCPYCYSNNIQMVSRASSTHSSEIVRVCVNCTNEF